MNRRGFLKFLGWSAAAAVMTPGQLLTTVTRVPTFPVAASLGPWSAELAAVTRRAFLPKLVEQMYHYTPTLSALLGKESCVFNGASSLPVPAVSFRRMTGVIRI